MRVRDWIRSSAASSIMVVLSSSCTPWPKATPLREIAVNAAGVRVLPAGEEVRRTAQIVVSFAGGLPTDAIMRDDSGRQRLGIPLSITPDPGCDWRRAGTDSLVCDLLGAQYLARATQYRVVLAPGWSTLDGRRVITAFEHSFSTVRPAIIYSELRDRSAPGEPRFEVIANTPLHSDSLRQAIRLVAVDGTAYPIQVLPFDTPKASTHSARISVSFPSRNEQLEDPFEDVVSTFSQGPHSHLIAPQEPLPRGKYELQIVPGLQSSAGPLAGIERRTLETFESYGDFVFRGLWCRTAPDSKERVRYSFASGASCQHGSLRLQFSSSVNTDRLNESTRIDGPGFVQGYLRPIDGVRGFLEPNTPPPGGEELYWDLHAGSIGRELRLRIEPFEDEFGRRLSSVVDERVRLAAQPASLDRVPRSMVFENDSAADLYFDTINADVPLQVSLQGTAGQQQTYTVAPGASADDLLHRVRPTSGRSVNNNEWVKGSVAARLFDPQYFYYDDGSMQRTSTQREFFAQRTPFNMEWFDGVTHGLVWVTHLQDALPVPGATVLLMRGQLGGAATAVARVTTDACGIARIDYSQLQRNAAGATHYLEVRRGTERGWMMLDRGAAHFRPATVQVAQHVFAFPSQPVYEPGELARVKLVARDLRSDGRQTPRAGEQLLEFRSAGQLVASLPRIAIRWSDFGTADFAVALPSNYVGEELQMFLVDPASPPGDAAAVRAGKLTITAAAKPLFNVTAHSQVTASIVAVQVSAQLFAGGPYISAPARITAQPRAGYFSWQYQKHSGFEFSTELAPATEPLPVLSAAGRTDAAGGFGAQFAMDPERWYLARLDYEASVADLAGRRLATRGTDVSAFRDRFVGVSLATGLANHESLAAQAVVVTADGTALRDIPIEVEIAHGAAQTLRPQPQAWKVVRTCSLRSAATPVSCAVTPPASGYYRVTGSVRDSRGREHRSQIQQFVGIGTASPWNRREPGVKLSTTHTANVGDDVAVELTSELERATALISVLTDRVLEARVQRLRKGRNLLQVKVSAAMAPSFRVHAVVQTPRLGHLSSTQLRRIGRDALQPLRHEVEQTVQVHEPTPGPILALSTDHDIYAPGDTARIELRNQDRGELEVALLAVDRSLLTLTEERRIYEPNLWVPDYYRTGAGRIAVSRQSLMAGALIGERAWGLLPLPRPPTFPHPETNEVPFLTGQRMGFGAEEAPQLLRSPRGNFRSVAYWNTKVVLEPGESRELELRWPDNVGQWSIIALAVGTERDIATTRRDVTVTKPLLVAAQLPSQLVAGDELAARFSITNLAASELQGSWQQQVSAPLQLRQPLPPSALSLIPNQPAVVGLPLRAVNAGTARLTFGAVAGDAQDAIELALPIRSTAVAAAQVEVGSLAGAGTQRVPLRLPADAVPASGRLDLYVGRNGLDLVVGALAFARDYPHACWEQSLTRAVGAAIYLQLAASLDPGADPGFAWPQARAVIDATLASASAFQADDGGMSFFERSQEPASGYLTAYTVVAFDWLRQAGFDPPARVEQRALEYLSANTGRFPERAAQWALAVPLLARTGRIDSVALEQMLTVTRTTDVATRSHVYAAWLASSDSGRRAQALEALRGETARASYLDSNGASWPLVTNTVAQCAIVINLLGSGNSEAFSLIGPRVRALQERASRRSRWGTTHENAMCAKALWDYHQRQQRSNDFAEVAVTATLNGKNLGVATLTGTRSQLQVLTQPVAIPGPQRLELRTSGHGTADFRAVLSYRRAAERQPQMASGLSVARSYHVRRGERWVELDERTRAQQGELLKVRLEIVAPTNRTLVVLHDPLPAGLEILNPRLTTTSREELGSARDHVAHHPFDHHAVRSDSMNYYAEQLRAGTYQLEYLTRVIAAGAFTALPPRIEEMYRPEVFATGTTQRLVFVASR